VNNSNKQSVEIAKLTEEFVTLKDARNLLEKKLRNCTCPSGGRTIKSGDQKIDHVMATAKAEIQKLVRSKWKFFKIIHSMPQFKTNFSLMN
jgi:hypothetical protein